MVMHTIAVIWAWFRHLGCPHYYRVMYPLGDGMECVRCGHRTPGWNEEKGGHITHVKKQTPTPVRSVETTTRR